MATTGHKEAGLIPIAEHRRYGGDIGQVGAAVEGVVAEQRVARLQRCNIASGYLSQQVTHAVSHRSQMHRDVGGIGHQGTRGIEQRTGEIQALANVHGSAALPQLFPHLFGDRHEAVAKQFRLKRVVRITLRQRWRTGLRLPALQQQRVPQRHPCLPALLQNRASGGFGDQSWA